jgi:ATP-dependent exoDNAse (exonuclease V) alpha subunit
VDGRFSNTEIVELVSSDERYIETKERLVKTEVLIVDEGSMISNKVMSQVEFLCRKVRKINQLFGNMQVILVGDFYKLPPVSNEMYGDFAHCLNFLETNGQLFQTYFQVDHVRENVKMEHHHLILFLSLNC